MFAANQDIGDNVDTETDTIVNFVDEMVMCVGDDTSNTLGGVQSHVPRDVSNARYHGHIISLYKLQKMPAFYHTVYQWDVTL